MTNATVARLANIQQYLRWPVIRQQLIAGWLSFLFISVSCVFSALRIVLIVPTVLGILLAPLFGIGILLLAPCLLLATLSAKLERSRIKGLLGHTLIAPQPISGSVWQRTLLNLNYWRYLVHMVASGLWGGLLALLFLIVLSNIGGFAALAVLFYGTEGSANLTFSWGLAILDTLVIGLVLIALLVIVPLICRGFAWTELWLAKFLVAGDQEQKIRDLSRQVSSLQESRTSALDSVAMERRRIERDLHDGPQQRLTAIAMDIGIALRKLDTDTTASREILTRAHTAAKDAITELRQVIRGIDPPILTERGLSAALPALAARSPITTSVEVDIPQRPSPTVESIVHFCVSEALTNVTKHAAAEHITVVARTTDTQLITTITDDGKGGANEAGGSGILGLRKRVLAVDGTLTVDSPPGGPTIMTVTIPTHQPATGEQS